MSRSAFFAAFCGVCLSTLLLGSQQESRGGRGAGAQGDGRGWGPPLYKLDEAYVGTPLPASEEKYRSIDGVRLKGWVNELVNISRRYHNAGHQYWGRITGTESDTQTQQWLVERFKQLGLENVRIQQHDLPPQWLPGPWELAVSGRGRSVKLESAQPMGESAGTPTGGISIEPVWVGMGAPADFIGRDVRGKAAVIYSNLQPSVRGHSAQSMGSLNRAREKGAAAIVVVMANPGNFENNQPGPAPASIPTMTVGLQDGNLIREIIEQAEPGSPAKLNLKLDVKTVAGLKTGTVWGTLPGTSDENIHIQAHLDGFFDGALDNASGIATMVGLAEYFSHVPRQQRRRTITFVGTSGHHAGSPSVRWMHENKEKVFAKTALIINCEHVAETQTYWNGDRLIRSNLVGARRWYVNGSEELKTLIVRVFDLFGIATYELPEARGGGELGAVGEDAPSFHIIDHRSYHSTLDTPEIVPNIGLAAATRSFAKIIDEVNRMEIRDLVRHSGAEK